MKPMGIALTGAASLLILAGLVYAIAIADTNVPRGDEPDEPCYFKGSDQEGGTLATRTSFWPPGVTCVHRDRNGRCERDRG